MQIERRETLPIFSPEHLVKIRQVVRTWAVELGFSLIDQTKLVTAASELARNTLEHGGGVEVRLEVLNNGYHQGLRLIFKDEGPGIVDIELAMRDGYTSANGLGMGLSGSKRLVNEFEISSKAGEGTCVTITKWK